MLAFLKSPSFESLPQSNKTLDLLLLLYQAVPENAKASTALCDYAVTASFRPYSPISLRLSHCLVSEPFDDSDVPYIYVSLPYIYVSLPYIYVSYMDA